MNKNKSGVVCGALLLLSLLVPGAWASLPGDAALWYAQPPRVPAVQLHFFWSRNCPHCQAARPFVESLPQTHPWIQVHSLEVSNHDANRSRFEQLAGLTGGHVGSVPGFFWCGRSFSGWGSDDSIGQWLVEELAACYEQVYSASPPGFLSRESGGASAGPPLPGGLDPRQLSLPLLTLLLGGLDAFNPCAFFVLLFLLSLLVNTRSRGRMLLVGGVFVLFSGFIYFLFMAAWLNLFTLLGGVGPLTLVAGMVAVAIALVNIKEYFRFKEGVSLTISEQNRGRLFRRMRGLLDAESLPALLTGAVVLAVAANSYELLCTAGFPMVYTRILTLEQLPAAGYYAYLALYNLVYVTPLLLIVIAFVYTLGRRKLSEGEGRLLKLLSGILMLSLGGVLILAPEALSQPLAAMGLFAVAIAATALVHWGNGRVG